MSWLEAWECCNIQHPFQTHLKFKSLQILFSYNFSVAQIILLCSVQNDWANDMDVVDDWDIRTGPRMSWMFHIMMHNPITGVEASPNMDAISGDLHKWSLLLTEAKEMLWKIIKGYLLHVARVIWHITEAFWCKGIPQGDLFLPIVIDLFIDPIQQVSLTSRLLGILELVSVHLAICLSISEQSQFTMWYIQLIWWDLS